MDVVKDVESKMQGAVEHLKREVKGLRSGRAHPVLVEGVKVALYGGEERRLKQVATVTVSGPRQLLITPFDTATASLIAKAIDKENLGVQVVAEAHVVRVNIPEMSGSAREEMVKRVRKMCEDAKVVIRNIRQDANKLVRKWKSSGEMAEDLVKKNEKKIQEATDAFCKMVDTVAEEKEKELRTL